MKENDLYRFYHLSFKDDFKVSVNICFKSFVFDRRLSNQVDLPSKNQRKLPTYFCNVKQRQCTFKLYQNINIAFRSLFSSGKRTKNTNPLRAVWPEVIDNAGIYFILIHCNTNIDIFVLLFNSLKPNEGIIL